MKAKRKPVPASKPVVDPDLNISCETIQGKRAGVCPSGPIRYGTCQTPFGDALMAISPRGICAIWFGGDLSELASQWPGAEFVEAQRAASELCREIFDGTSEPVPVHLRGTEFQISVWLALLSIPRGSVKTYQEIALQIGKPEATRAVASAIARNEIGFLVPCHRVIQASGKTGQYRWGAARKKAMIDWEASQR